MFLATLYQPKIRTKYSVSAELAILRQRNSKPEEFSEYNAFCELCKSEAKKELNVQSVKEGNQWYWELPEEKE